MAVVGSICRNDEARLFRVHEDLARHIKMRAHFKRVANADMREFGVVVTDGGDPEPVSGAITGVSKRVWGL